MLRHHPFLPTCVSALLLSLSLSLSAHASASHLTKTSIDQDDTMRATAITTRLLKAGGGKLTVVRGGRLAPVEKSLKSPSHQQTPAVKPSLERSIFGSTGTNETKSLLEANVQRSKM